MTPTDSDSVSEPVNGVLAEYLLRIDAGERVDRQQFLREHPGVAGQLRAYFEDLDAIRNALGEKVSGSAAEPSPFGAAEAAAEPPRQSDR